MHNPFQYSHICKRVSVWWIPCDSQRGCCQENSYFLLGQIQRGKAEIVRTFVYKKLSINFVTSCNSAIKNLLLLIFLALLPFQGNAAIYKGTITIEVGENYSVDVGFSYSTVSGYWTKSNSTFGFRSQGQRSCTIYGINEGTGNLRWKGVVNADDFEYYWTVEVKAPYTPTEGEVFEYNGIKYSICHIQQRPDSLRLPWERWTAVSYSFTARLCLPIRKQKYTGDLLWHDYA